MVYPLSHEVLHGSSPRLFAPWVQPSLPRKVVEEGSAVTDICPIVLGEILSLRLWPRAHYGPLEGFIEACTRTGRSGLALFETRYNVLPTEVGPHSIQGRELGLPRCQKIARVLEADNISFFWLPPLRKRCRPC